MALLFMLSGCGFPRPVPITEAGIHGTWVSWGPQGQTAILVFSENGSFRGTDLPGDVFRPFVTDDYPSKANWLHQTERHGTWQIGYNEDIGWTNVVLHT
ncbi:hypothetical protein ACIPWF_22800 [Paenarthrobacter sp. NPDC089989]|uniref:hypothetical protein n=1 Tax=unclassified Paenarthrobacter TaxID=2634190 RepID=UPI0037F916D1